MKCGPKFVLCCIEDEVKATALMPRWRPANVSVLALGSRSDFFGLKSYFFDHKDGCAGTKIRIGEINCHNANGGIF